MDKRSIGNAGEYFAAGELERRGLTAAVTLGGTKDFDILAVNKSSGTQYKIQVKTVHNKKKEWTLSKKNEGLTGENCYYIFVSLNDLDAPEYHIVPSDNVAREIKANYNTWLKTPGRNNKPHNENNIRKFNDFNDKWLNSWNLLK